MKLSSIVLLVLTPSTFAASVAEIKAAGSAFDRSLFFSNALCLPLLDECNFRSDVADCSNDSDGDSCSDGGTCVKTTERGVVCAKKKLGDGNACSNSRDCESDQICVTFGDCRPKACFTQVRRG